MPPEIDFVPDVQNDEGAPGAIDFQPDQAAALFGPSSLDLRPTFIPTLPPAETSPKLEAAKEMALALPQAFGIGLGAVEKGVGAAIGRIAGTGDTLEDVKRAIEEGEPLPVELSAAKARGIGGTLARVGLGLAETAPKIASLALFPGGILAQSIAAGGIFGLDAQGRFSPRAAAVGALLPGAGALAKGTVARALAGAMERGTIGTMHPATQWITEEMGHQAALNAVMLTADSPELIELYHTDRDAFRRKIEDTIGMNLAFGLFGGIKRLRGAPTATQEYVRKNAEKFGKIADKMITQQIVGGAGQQAIEQAIAEAKSRQKYAGFIKFPGDEDVAGGTQPMPPSGEEPPGFVPVAGPQLPPIEPKGPANAVQIGIPAPLPVEVPPEARPEVGGQVREPEQPAEARPPAEPAPPPVEPAKPVEPPKQPDVPQLSGLPEDIRQLFAGTPPPPKKKSIPIVIEIDGVQQPAYFEGYGTTATSLEPINPWISRLSDGGWTTGPIQPDAKIVWGKIPEAPKPAEEKPPEKAPEAQKPAAEPPAIDRSRTFTEQEAEDAGIASQLAREGWSFNLFDRKWSFKQTEPPKPTEPEAKPEETVAREPDQLQRFVGIVKLAADSPDKLRSSDVDRVMSEVSPEEVEAFRTWLLSKALPDDTIKEVVNWKPEQPTEAKPPTEFPQYPKPLTKEERKKNVFGAISKRIKAWEDSIKQWLTGRPENKAIIWEEPEIQGVKGPAKGNVKALTRNIGDDKNPWRVTVFNERNGAYMPFGHRVYPTREAALVEEARDVMKLHESMPGRVMDEQEVQGYKLMKDVPDPSTLVWYKFSGDPRILRERLRGTALMQDFVRDSQTADGKVAFTKPVTADLQDPAKIADRLKWLQLEEIAPEKPAEREIKIVYDEDYKGPRYRYGMRNRPLQIGAQPKGWIIGSDKPHPDFKNFGTIDYPFPLTKEELYSYELVDLGEVKPTLPPAASETGTVPSGVSKPTEGGKAPTGQEPSMTAELGESPGRSAAAIRTDIRNAKAEIKRLTEIQKRLSKIGDKAAAAKRQRKIDALKSKLSQYNGELTFKTVTRRKREPGTLSEGITPEDGLLFDVVALGRVPIFMPDGIVMAQYKRLKSLSFRTPAQVEALNKILESFPADFEGNFGVDGSIARAAWDAAKRAGIENELFVPVKDGRRMMIDADFLEPLRRSKGVEFKTREFFEELTRLANARYERTKGRGSEAAEGAAAEREVRQGEALKEDLAKRTKDTTVLIPDNIAIGTQFTLKGTRLRVTDLEFDEDGRLLWVMLDDGNKYGTQRIDLEDGRTELRMDIGSLKQPKAMETADEFLSPEEAEPTIEAPKPAETFEQHMAREEDMNDWIKSALQTQRPPANAEEAWNKYTAFERSRGVDVPGKEYFLSAWESFKKPVAPKPEVTPESIRKQLNRGYYNDAAGATWKVQQGDNGQFYVERTFNGDRQAGRESYDTIEEAQASAVEQIQGKPPIQPSPPEPIVTGKVLWGRLPGEPWVKLSDNVSKAEQARRTKDGWEVAVMPKGESPQGEAKPTPKPSTEPKLSDRERQRLSDLQMKDRANRDAIGRGELGDPLTPEEQREYEALTAKAGQRTLFDVDEVVAETSRPVLEGQLRNLEKKLAELKRQQLLSLTNAQTRKMGGDKAKEFMDAARTYEKRIQEAINEIVDIKRKLRIGLNAEEYKAAPVEPTSVEDLFSQPERPKAPTPPKAAEPVNASQENMRAEIADIERKLQLLDLEWTDANGKNRKKKAMELGSEINKLNMRLNLLRSDLTEGQGEVVLRTPIAENPLTGEYESREYRLRQMTSQEFMDYFKDPMQRMQEFDTVYTPWRAEMRRVYYDESGKETRHDPWYIDAIQKTREEAIEKAASYSGRSAEGWKEIRDTLNKPKGPEISLEKPSAPISAGKEGVSKGAGAAAQPVAGLTEAESARLAELTAKAEANAPMTKAERERFIELQTKAGARGGDERPEVRPGGDEPPANLGGGLEPGQGMRSEAEVHAAIAGEDTAGFPVKVITQQQAVELTGRAEARGYGGFFWKGSVYMVRDNLSPDPKYREQVRQLLREEVGHGLLRTQAGLRLLSEVLDAGKLNLTDAERQKLLDMGYREHQLLDEFIAKSARENLPWWKEMVERARVMLSKLGLAKLSNEEVSRMLLRQIRAEMLDKADAPIGLPAVSAGPSVGGKLLPGFDRMRSPRTKIKDLKPGDLIRFNGNLFGVDRVESDAVMKNEAKLFLSNEQGSGSVTIGNKNDPLSNWEPVSESVLQSAGLARFREGPAPAPAVGREPEIPTPEGERPSGPKMGVTQVAGEKIGIERPMEFIAGIRQRLRTGYFDGSQPVEPGRTENAWQIAQMMVNPETRGTFASDLQRAGGGEMAPGLLRNELWNYAVRQAVRGDTRLMEFMVRQSQNFQTLAGEALADGDTALGRGLRAARNRAFGGLWSRLIGFRNEQLAATGRRLQQGEAGLRQIIEAIDGLVANIGDIDAFERGLRTPEIQRIIDRTSDTGRAADEVVGNATFVPPERRASILETVYQWMSREVDPRADQAPFVDTLKAELERLRLTPEQAQTIADATWNRKLTVDGVVRRRLWDKELRKLDALAEKTADSFILSVDQAEWKRPEQPNEVRDIIKEALKSEAPLDSNNLLGFKRDLTQRLITAGLSEEKARDLANAITTRRETDLLNAQLRVRNRAVESKSLKSLVESLRSSPYLAQNDPQWRFDTAVRWFESNGVPREQAQEAAKLFDEQFVAALTKAAEQAAKRLITKGDYGRNIPELIEAIRLGLTDPSKNWTEEIAKREGFRPMSREDQQRLAELEQKYSNPNLSAHEQVALVEQMMGIVRHAGDSKGRVMQIMGESFAASLLSGIRTMTLNWMQPWFTMLATGASHAAFEPRDFPTVVRSMWNASKNWWPEYKYAWSKDAYELSSEEQVFHSNALKTAFEEAQTDWAKGKYSQAILKFTYGWQQYVIRGLQAADQAGMVVAREWKMALYGSIAMRAAGLKTSQITELVDIAEGFKRAEYERALYEGKSHNEAQVIANESTIDALTNFFENKLGSREKAEAVKEAALYDAFNIVGRRAHGVEESDEGFLTRYSGINRIMRFVSETRREGGGASMLTIMAVGFMNVPLRTARFYAGFGPYGILRWGIDKYRTNRGYTENLWKQSYKNEYQSKARLREALIGTSLMLAFLGWQHRHHTSDEDAEKKAFAMYVTGNGPSNKTMRDAWLKRGFEPYTLHVIADGKIRSKLPVNRVGQILAFPLGLAASLDDLAWRRKQEEATSPGSKKEFAGREIVAAMGTYYNIVGAQGVLQAFSHLSQIGQGQSGTGRAVGVSLASTASALAIPGKSLIQGVTDMITGPVDRSSVEAAMISNFPVLNVLWNGQAINRFGDPIGDRTWSAKLTKLGFPVLLRVSDTPENKALYQMILDKGAPPPDLRRYIVEDKYGPLSQDDWQKFVKISGSALKSEVLSNLDTLNGTDPHGVKLFMNRAADIANDQAAQALHLTPKPTFSASSGSSGDSAVPTLPKSNVGLPSSARISVPGGASGGRISTGGGSRGYGGGFGPGTTGIRRGTTGRLSLSGFTGGQRRFVHGRLRAHVTRVRGIGRKSRVSIPRRSFRRRRISLRA